MDKLDTFKYRYNSGNVHNFYKHGGLLCKQMAKSYGKGVWVICAKPLLLNF